MLLCKINGPIERNCRIATYQQPKSLPLQVRSVKAFADPSNCMFCLLSQGLNFEGKKPLKRKRRIEQSYPPMHAIMAAFFTRSSPCRQDHSRVCTTCQGGKASVDLLFSSLDPLTVIWQVGNKNNNNNS